MTYIDGFVIPVPPGKKQAYAEWARTAHQVYLEHGALRVVESWGDDMRRGKLNDFYTSVVAEADEGIVFSWIEWADKLTRDTANQKIMADPRMRPQGDLPFIGARVVYGGFATLLESKK